MSVFTAEYQKKRWGIEPEAEPDTCSRGAGEAKHLRCKIYADTKCFYCPDRRPICEAHNFGTTKEPMCFECAKEVEQDHTEPLMIAGADQFGLSKWRAGRREQKTLLAAGSPDGYRPGLLTVTRFARRSSRA